MENRTQKPKRGGNDWVSCRSSMSISLDLESEFCAGENNDWVDCSKRTKYSNETNQQYATSEVEHGNSESFFFDNAKSVEIPEKKTYQGPCLVQNKDHDLQNSMDILSIIPESSDYVEFVKKKTKDIINTAIEESNVKKMLKRYNDKHEVTEKALPLSEAALCSPTSLPKIPSVSKCGNWSNYEATEIDKDVLNKQVFFTNLEIMVTTLQKEKGPRPEAPFFIRSLCRDIKRATLLIMDDITEEIITLIGDAASLIADMVKKDLEPESYRGYSLEDIGIVDLITSVLECILDSTRISQFSGGRNNFAHNVVKNLIPSEEIRKFILVHIILAIKRSYCNFYVAFEGLNRSTGLIPSVEINGLFHYFQLLTMVILCSSEEPWIEESDVESIKELERIAKTKLPLHLVATYATRTAVFAMKYEKKTTPSDGYPN